MRRARFPPRFTCGAALVVLSLLGGAARPAVAIDPAKAISQYTLTVWQTEDGLPQDSLTAIAQHVDGSLWLGSPSGLVRFDGTSFVPVVRGEDDEAGDRYITGILAGRDGTLWATTRGPLLEIGAAGELRHEAKGRGPVGATALVDAGDGTLWLGSERGLLRFADGAVAPYSPAGDAPDEAGIIALASGTPGRWYAATTQGLFVLEGGRARRFPLRGDAHNDVVTGVLDARDGRIWVGTSLGLGRLEGDTIEFPTALAPLAGQWVRCLLQDRDGTLWIGTRGGGAFRLRGDQLDSFSVEQGLPNNLVRQILEDRDGAIWFATAGGLARLLDGPVRTWSEAEGMSVGFLWTAHEDPAGELWLGTSGGGVVRLGERGPQPAPFFDSRLIGVEIRALHTARDGTLYVGTGGNGLAAVRENRVRWLDLGAEPDVRWVSSLLEDRDGTLWVGTALGLVRVGDDRVVERLAPESRGGSRVVRALARDPEGTIWVGTTAGLARIEGGRWRSVAGAEPLARARIHCILPEPRGGLWLATDGGLARFDRGKLERWTVREGLPVDMLYWLIDDDRGNFWISSDAGILRLPEQQIEEMRAGARARLEPLVLGRSDGLRATECNSGHPAGVRRRDGTFCFPTIGGLSCADPARLRAIAEPPPVEIREVLVDGAGVHPSSPEEAIVIPAGRQRIELHFAAIALTAPEKLSFRYRLVGFDRTWVEAGRAQVAQFTRLAPGRYRFEVAARRGEGTWNTPAAAIELEIRPAFHQTSAFVALVAGCILLAGGAVLSLRTRQLRTRARKLAAVVEARTRDLARANNELERMSLADGLTGLANRRHFDLRLDAEWLRAVRSRAPIALVLADLDHFKAYNDNHGHLAGDDCLRAVAHALADGVQRAEDLVARYGGEEFAVLLPGTTAADAALVAERLRVLVERLERRHGASPTDCLTLSLGVAAAVPGPHSRPESLIADADRALYLAKARGRNRVERS